MAHGLSSFTWKESILLAFSPKNVSLSLSLLFAIVVSFENQRRLSESAYQAHTTSSSEISGYRIPSGLGPPPPACVAMGRWGRPGLARGGE